MLLCRADVFFTMICHAEAKIPPAMRYDVLRAIFTMRIKNLHAARCRYVTPRVSRCRLLCCSKILCYARYLLDDFEAQRAIYSAACFDARYASAMRLDAWCHWWCAMPIYVCARRLRARIIERVCLLCARYYAMPMASRYLFAMLRDVRCCYMLPLMSATSWCFWYAILLCLVAHYLCFTIFYVLCYAHLFHVDIAYGCSCSADVAFDVSWCLCCCSRATFVLLHGTPCFAHARSSLWFFSTIYAMAHLCFASPARYMAFECHERGLLMHALCHAYFAAPRWCLILLPFYVAPIFFHAWGACVTLSFIRARDIFHTLSIFCCHAPILFYYWLFPPICRARFYTFMHVYFALFCRACFHSYLFRCLWAPRYFDDIAARALSDAAMPDIHACLCRLSVCLLVLLPRDMFVYALITCAAFTPLLFYALWYAACLMLMRFILSSFDMPLYITLFDVSFASLMPFSLLMLCYAPCFALFSCRARAGYTRRHAIRAFVCRHAWFFLMLLRFIWCSAMLSPCFIFRWCSRWSRRFCLLTLRWLCQSHALMPCSICYHVSLILLIILLICWCVDVACLCFTHVCCWCRFLLFCFFFATPAIWCRHVLLTRVRLWFPLFYVVSRWPMFRWCDICHAVSAHLMMLLIIMLPAMSARYAALMPPDAYLCFDVVCHLIIISFCFLCLIFISLFDVTMLIIIVSPFRLRFFLYCFFFMLIIFAISLLLYCFAFDFRHSAARFRCLLFHALIFVYTIYWLAFYALMFMLFCRYAMRLLITPSLLITYSDIAFSPDACFSPCLFSPLMLARYLHITPALIFAVSLSRLFSFLRLRFLPFRLRCYDTCYEAYFSYAQLWCHALHVDAAPTLPSCWCALPSDYYAITCCWLVAYADTGLRHTTLITFSFDFIFASLLHACLMLIIFHDAGATLFWGFWCRVAIMLCLFHFDMIYAEPAA